ncbi:MAG: response regulator transcription factor [Butyricicoccus pullicaecorum]|jgi:DNA-binding response OmpR family regulator|nr:response regulator transcription factor [Butyricicoccus pullicaecorum]
MATILLADDEARIRRLVIDFLKRDGHTILEAADGNEALTLLRTHPEIELAILDVMMPGADGFSVLQSIRAGERTRRLPVMMLTARAEEFDQLHGLQGGADDYVTKPFSPLVLCARVKNLLLRSGAPQESEDSVFGELDIDEIRHEVRVSGVDIGLTPKEYELMVYFKNNRSIALSREKILNAVWGYDYFGDLRTVDTHIKKLRAKLGEYGSKIETVRGYGYRFEV